MKKREPIKDKGNYLVDYRRAGRLIDDTNCLVMDNVWDRDKQKLRVKAVRTSNPGLYAGSSTVAIFKIKKPLFANYDVVRIKREYSELINEGDGRVTLLEYQRGSEVVIASSKYVDGSIVYMVSTEDGRFISFKETDLEPLFNVTDETNS